MVGVLGAEFRERFGPGAILGTLAGSSLFVGLPWRRILPRLPSTAPVSLDGYAAEVIEAIAVIGANTLVGPVLGTILTALLVVWVMYEAFDLADIRETASLYTTWTFRLLLALLSGGFGLIFIRVVPGNFQINYVIWMVVVAVSLLAFTYYTTDHTNPENPAVTMMAKIRGDDPEEFRSVIAHRDAPDHYSVLAFILASAFILCILTMTFGVVVYLATILYPLPEILVLIWVFVQVVGVGSLPVIGRVTDVGVGEIGIEGRLFDELGTATSSWHSLMLAFTYLVLLLVPGLLFSGLLLLSLYFFIVYGPPLIVEFTDSPFAILHTVVAIIGVLVATGYFFLYWFVQMLRLPAVVKRDKSDSDAAVNPRHRRIEGLTLPAGALLIWQPFSSQLLVGQSSPSLTQWVGGVTVNFVLISACLLTIYRFRWAGLDPQPVTNEERVVLAAVAATTASIFLTFGLYTDNISTSKAVALPFMTTSVLGILLYHTKQEMMSDPDPSTSTKETLGMLGAIALTVGFIIVWTWIEPSFLIPAVILTGLVATLAAGIIIMDKVYFKSGGD